MTESDTTTASHMLSLSRDLMKCATAISQLDSGHRGRLAATLDSLGDCLHLLDRHARAPAGPGDDEFARTAELLTALLNDLDNVLDSTTLARQRRWLGTDDITVRLRAELAGSTSVALQAVETAAGEFAALAVGLSGKKGG